GGECLDGTVRFQDTCVPFDPFDKTPPIITVDPPVRTRFVGDIRLTSNEPAEIYVTTDDTAPTLESVHERDQLIIPNDDNRIVIRFFAVDLAGNQSLEQLVLWNIDQEGPAPPARFNLTRTGDTRKVDWTPPQNENRLGGVLVARVEGRVNVQPTSGIQYAIGDEIEPGITVVSITDADPAPATFSETLPATPGLVRYIGWAFDDLLNFGPPAGDFEVVPMGPQRGLVFIDLTASTVLQGTKPDNVTLSGTATVSGSNVTLKLAVRNETTRVLHAPKLLVRSAGVTFNSDGVFDTFPYKAYGAAINPGASATVTWQFTGVSGNSLSLDLDLRDNRVVMLGSVSKETAGSVNDFATGREVKRLAPGPGDAKGGFGPLGGGFTPDGRVVFGSRSSGTISSWDLQSGNRLATTELRAQKSHVPQLALDPSGSIGYALISEEHIRKLRDGFGVETELVRFDTATLSDQGRISIGISRNRDMRISDDGRFLIVATGVAARGVLVIDLASFTVARNLVSGTRAESAVFTPDGRGVAVMGSDLQVFDVEDGTVISTSPIPTGGKLFRAAFNGPNEIWVGGQSALHKIDLTNTIATETFGFPVRTLDVFDGKIYAGNGDLRRFDPDFTEELQFPFFNQRGHWLGRSPF
nr:chitobiase/beta-hexosaminidase C-terminal domain-containing protein [Deltaproteobacteria bacterium]